MPTQGQIGVVGRGGISGQPTPDRAFTAPRIALYGVLAALVWLAAWQAVAAEPTPAWAKVPIAHLTGPTVVQAGDLAVFRTSGSSYQQCAWLIVPVEASGCFLPVLLPGGGQAAIFASRKTGNYTVVFAATGDGQLALESLTFANQSDTPVPPNPPNPPVPPVPPTPPDANRDAAKKIAAVAAAKLPAFAKADALLVATAYESVAARIGKDITTSNQLIAATRMAREQVIVPTTESQDAWRAFAVEIGTWMQGLTVKTLDDCKPLWLGVADGLREVK